MNTMGCEETRDLLPLYTGGDLPIEQADLLATHVAGCPSCARELDLYREARAGLLSLRAVEAPAGTFETIRAVVGREFLPRRPRPGISWPDEVLRHAAVLMVGLAIGVGVHVALRRPSPVSVAAEARPGVRAEFVGTFIPDRRTPIPPSAPEHGFYLPKVDAVLVGGEKDF